MQVIEALHTKTPFWPVPLIRAVNVNASDSQGPGRASVAAQDKESPARQPPLPAAVESTPGGTRAEPMTKSATASMSRPLSREEDRPKSTASNGSRAFALLPSGAEPAVFEDMPKSEMEGKRLGVYALYFSDGCCCGSSLTLNIFSYMFPHSRPVLPGYRRRSLYAPKKPRPGHDFERHLPWQSNVPQN